MAVIVPPEYAKTIKLKKSFKIIPNIKASDNKLVLKGFKILELNSNNLYVANYTNINFEPEKISLRVTGMKESINQGISNYFQKHKQKDSPIIDTTKKEIWYIDLVKSINAKMPGWFSNPIQNDSIIGYGQAKTLDEAKSNARNELAYMIKVKVNTKFSSTKEINSFKSFKEIKLQTSQSSNIELDSSDYTIYKQEKIDGNWYVGFKYLK